MVAAGIVALGVLGVVAFNFDASANADFPAPAKQAVGDADLDPFEPHTADGHPGHVCKPYHGGYTYTPHRYPRMTGGEITAIIHRGFSPMRVPSNAPDANWIVSPPSEVSF
jgi:hypothetical protein